MDPTERQLDLLAFLLAARDVVPRADIFDAFADEYAGSDEARERKFTRDKKALEELGVPLEWVAPEDNDGDGGYRVRRDAFFLPDIPLTPDERAALYAAGAAALEIAFPLRTDLAFALAKLRSGGKDEPAARPVMVARPAPAGEVVDVVARAVAERRRLRLRYGEDAQPREFDPYAFSARRGRFAIVGHCHLRGALRTFYADRICACELANPAAKGPEFEVPAGFDAAPHLPAHPWQLRVHAPVEVELAFAPDLAESGPRALGLEPGRPCPATHLDGLVAEVLALGPGATIRSPASARERLVEMLAPLHARLVGGAP